MTSELEYTFTATELLKLKTALEWLTGYYSGVAGIDRPLPIFVKAELDKLDKRLQVPFNG